MSTMSHLGRNIVTYVAVLMIAGLCTLRTLSQAPSGQPDAYSEPPTNLKLLKVDKPEDLRPIMQHFNQSLGVRCSFCHDREDFAKDMPHKEMARTMIKVVSKINSQIFTWENAPSATCNMCHNGNVDPKFSPPSLRGTGQSRALRAAIPAEVQD